MTESEAYNLAVEYLKKVEIVHYGCTHRNFVDLDNYPGVDPRDLPKGGPRKRWYFIFALSSEPLDGVVSGGDVAVCVDDATGVCRHDFTL
jgi:hypothetical protein